MIRIENQCVGKHPYETKEAANVSAAHHNKLGGRRLVSYRCGVCGAIHIGHHSKGKRLNPKDNTKNKPIDYEHIPGVHIGDKRFLK